jgi:hypothetical protein
MSKVLSSLIQVENLPSMLDNTLALISILMVKYITVTTLYLPLQQTLTLSVLPSKESLMAGSQIIFMITSILVKRS